MSDKTEGQLLAEKLLYKKQSAFDVLDTDAKAAAAEYAKGYTSFIDGGKTERECVKLGMEIAEAAGYKPYKMGDTIKSGDRFYYNNRGKSLYVVSVGSEPIENGVRIAAGHIDSPRLDLKQHPLYESEGFAYLKTHYYGGIRKYQWVTIPLALHGIVTKQNGETVEIIIGEDDSDPVFCITDLLPHLAKDQNSQALGSAFKGEGMNLLIGSTPYADDSVSDKVKLNVLAYLNEKYGITEADFMSAELTAVPAGKARDIGLDRALIGAYGHDDRVCSYPALTAVLGSEGVHTSIAVLIDKEEIGSEGNSGMQSRLLSDLIDELAASLGGNPRTVRANSICLSADVAAAYDPLYSEVFEKRNTAIVGSGVVLCKYVGSGGKSSTNDASAEFIARLRCVFGDNEVVWQTSELGKVDQGGGGTVAKYIANLNIEVVDLGVPVLSMHAPFEIISKLDLYQTHCAFSAFLK